MGSHIVRIIVGFLLVTFASAMYLLSVRRSTVELLLLALLVGGVGAIVIQVGIIGAGVEAGTRKVLAALELIEDAIDDSTDSQPHPLT